MCTKHGANTSLCPKLPDFFGIVPKVLMLPVDVDLLDDLRGSVSEELGDLIKGNSPLVHEGGVGVAVGGEKKRVTPS